MVMGRGNSRGPDATSARYLPRLYSLLIACTAVLGCAHAPPPSKFPNARAAIDAMRATYACSHGVQGESKVDYFGEYGRIRGSLLFVISRPEQVRLDVFSPFGATISTLTADGSHFALLDFHEKAFFSGPANTCNVTRFLHVPIPPHALAELFIGMAPVLTHRPEDASIAWEGGMYVIRIASKHAAREEIGLEPNPADWNRPWNEQRIRVRRVYVEQQGVKLYEAELDEHEAAKTAGPRKDPDGIDPDVPPSGPSCSAEVPRRLRFVSDVADQDVIFDHKEVVHNPPLMPGVFQQSPPRGVRVHSAECSESG